MLQFMGSQRVRHDLATEQHTFAPWHLVLYQLVVSHSRFVVERQVLSLWDAGELGNRLASIYLSGCTNCLRIRTS